MPSTVITGSEGDASSAILSGPPIMKDANYRAMDLSYLSRLPELLKMGPSDLIGEKEEAPTCCCHCCYWSVVIAATTVV
ncbi:hypothetical protein ACLOJK_019289 [Asimina triloba]